MRSAPAVLAPVSDRAADAPLGVGVALAGLALAFMVVFVWRIGGVVLVLDRHHGVHSGDLLAFPLLLPALASLRRWLATAA
ncbi:MAG: hypothetical protein GEV08_18565 [Acidimicrobiia bacterium]|nr:hypothetical protein [Acidimicrobiia bacterium]